MSGCTVQSRVGVRDVLPQERPVESRITIAKIQRIVLAVFAFAFALTGVLLTSSLLFTPVSWGIKETCVHSFLTGFATGFCGVISMALWRAREKVHDFSDAKEVEGLRKLAPNMTFEQLLKKFSLPDILTHKLVPFKELRKKCQIHFADVERFQAKGVEKLARLCLEEGLLTKKELYFIVCKNFKSYRGEIGYHEWN